MNPLEILYEDHHMIVVNKPATMPSQPDPTHSHSALRYLRKKFKQSFHLINRIDRPASGAMLIAKTTKAAAALNKMVQKNDLEKIYLAAVQKLPQPEEGILQNYLLKKKMKAYISSDSKQGKLAQLQYKLKAKSERYFLLEVLLETGRFHQIRAQLAHIGSPIKGDVKYGARRSNKDRSIHLHAWKLNFKHPFTGEDISVTAPLPDDPVWNSIAFEA